MDEAGFEKGDDGVQEFFFNEELIHLHRVNIAESVNKDTELVKMLDAKKTVTSVQVL